MKFILVICFLFILRSYGFTINNGRMSRVTIKKFSSNYQKMLEQAKLGKQQPARPASIVPKQQSSPSPKQSTSIKSRNNGLPFSNEMYDHLKFVIECLTAKIKSDTSLSPEQLQKLKVSINAIIADGKDDDAEDEVKHHLLYRIISMIPTK